jgi:hypothetical protein
MSDVTLEDINVMCVIAEGGAAGARAAFDRLEAKLPSLRGRKFYGAYYPERGEYRACVTLEPGEDPATYGFDSWVIPGGRYVREKMKDWTTKIPEIGKAFVALADRERSRVDDTRPSLEFYRSEDELILLLPVR